LLAVLHQDTRDEHLRNARNPSFNFRSPAEFAVLRADGNKEFVASKSTSAHSWGSSIVNSPAACPPASTRVKKAASLSKYSADEPYKQDATNGRFVNAVEIAAHTIEAKEHAFGEHPPQSFFPAQFGPGKFIQAIEESVDDSVDRGERHGFFACEV